MNVDGAFEQSVRLIREHERAENLDEFAAFGGEDGSTKDAVVGGVDDELHETSGFAALDGAGDVGHRTSADLQLETFGASFFFGEAYTAELRIGEDAVRDEAVFNSQILSFDEIAVNNLEVIVRDVGERGAAFAIAESPNARNIGLEAAVHFDEAVLVGFNACFVEGETVGVGTATSGDQEMRAGNARRARR